MPHKRSQPTVGIIGLGKIGELYSKYLNETGYRIFSIDNNPDKKADFATVHSMSSATINSIDVWIIATPTGTHLTSAQAILHVSPEARILIEKPICLPHQTQQMRSLLTLHPRARALVNDIYAISRALTRFTRLLKNWGKEVSSIMVELSKNRDCDEQNGRFIDTDFGDFGYEGFHLLSIRDALMQATGTSPAKIQIYSSVRGKIGFPFLRAASLYVSPDSYRHISRRYIEPGSEFRYRVAEVLFEDGSTASLVFEPFFGLTNCDFKNTHLIEFTTPGKSHYREVIVANQLREGLFTQIDQLLKYAPTNLESVFSRQDEMSSLAVNSGTPQTQVAIHA